jgi:phage terminase large subunit-like protein
MFGRERVWDCGLSDCDGEPHLGAWWCQHDLESHPVGSEFWRCRHARAEQLPPSGSWRVWMIQAGRGWGKSRTGAEWLAAQVRAHPGFTWAVAAPTRDDLKATCLEGESGLLAALGIRIGDERYNRSDLQISLGDGTVIRSLTAERPDRSRGPNLAGAWCDELSSWKYEATWHEGLMPALRRGDAQVVITTTPKPVPLVREFAGRDDGTVVVTKGATFDNRANLSAVALDEMRRRYEGTRLGRQEIYGELLEDVPGALWTLQLIDDARVVYEDLPVLRRVVVAVDPSGGDGEGNDEQGVVVAGVGEFYVLADLTCKLTPDGWARRTVQAYRDFRADRIVAEVNFGYAMVASTIRNVDANVAVREVHASRNKVQRAEPIAALYEQHRVHHAGLFEKLEDQMATWVPGSKTIKSPDRMDALVWALTDLSAGVTASTVSWGVEERSEAGWGEPSPASSTVTKTGRQQVGVGDGWNL